MYVPHGPLIQIAKSTSPIAHSSSLNAFKIFVAGLMKLALDRGCFAVEIEPKIGEFVPGLLPAGRHGGEMSEGLSHFTDKSYLRLFLDAGFIKTGRNFQSKYKLLFDLGESDDELLARMKKNTRYNIGYAERKGVEVEEIKFSDPKATDVLNQMYELMLETQKRAKGYPIRPKSSFEKLLSEFKDTGNMVFEVARHQGDVLGINITQRTKNWSSSFYAGTSREKSNLKAPYLLRWHSIRNAKKTGSKIYDFWGFVPNDKQHSGYSEHKISFGGTRIDHVGLLAFPINELKYQVWDKLIPLRSRLASIFRR
jgi:lipid II:glycine glycyltransferase (peptidoglycan interpeptide bridge formation enzyme)